MGLREVSIAFSLRDAAGRVLDTLLPPHSLMTGQALSREDLDGEAELWQHISFLDDPCCDACGFPFEYDHGENVLCGRCHGRRPAYDRVRSAIQYNEHSKKLVLDFKHGGRTDGLDFFSLQMRRAGRELLAGAHMIIPVPLHRARLRQRRFNQSALLARALSRQTGLPYNTDILSRRKNTPSQAGQTFLGRKRNVSGAFKVQAAKKSSLKDKNVLLIDDVYTTGATLAACAKALKRAGAGQVDALTLMRVVRPVVVAT